VSAELGQALSVLSDALDLVGVGHHLHGRRVAWLVERLLGAIGADDAIEDGHYAGLVHDCGATSPSEHLHLLEHTQLEDRHCRLGARLLEGFAPLAHLAPAIEFHHTPWPELSLEPRLALIANAIFLADRMDVVHAHCLREPGALAALMQRKLFEPWGAYFHRPLLEAARELLDGAEVAAMLDGDSAVLAQTRPRQPSRLGLSELRQLALLFAQAVDAKSAFTAAHSFGVAALASHLGRAEGLSLARTQVLEISALLHDLGKLGVPAAVLDKPGPLSSEELVVMRGHAAGSQQLLSRIDGFEFIATIAGLHHEYLDGSGYPSGHGEAHLPLEARIITVADIFQALAQDRPYRAAMAPPEIMRVLDEHVARGRVQRSLVAHLHDDLPRALQLATSAAV
jgi:HD-GYP domain-containing protein (c-di-GMP phosphodiesterase class II)